jgi:hypothetical protein
MTDTIFIPRPIEEKPEKDGRYYVINEGTGESNFVAFFEGNWEFAGNNATKEVRERYTHFLVFTDRKEYIRQIAENAWKAAVDHNIYFHPNAGWPEGKSIPLTKEDYLNSLK